MIGAILLMSAMSVFFFPSATTSAQAASSDALALRVVPNPKHYSALSWYKQQGFSGSPQSVVIDGYEGVRDGRTVYVNAANVPDGVTMYTNIYLISYNQDSEESTVDIFGQILKYWKFNSNLYVTGRCSGGQGCLADSECPIGEYCYSFKAGVARDTRRLADLADIRIALGAYKNSHKGKYPLMSSGSYLKGRSLSVWPSWLDTFSKELGVRVPADPINQAGDCGNPRFDSRTCWDEKARQFAFDPSGPGFAYNSSLYYYSVLDNGDKYDLCATMDTNMTDSACRKVGSFLCQDNDGDGYDTCGVGELGGDVHPADCNDLLPAAHPGTAEICNGVDDNCNGQRDEGFSLEDCSHACSYQGYDYNGTRAGNLRCCGNDLGEGLPEAGHCSDGLDNDCDGLIDSGDLASCPLSCTDNDGDYHISEGLANFALCNHCGPSGTEACLGNNDCNDSDTQVRHGLPEVCDGKNNDCLGGADDGFTEETCENICLALNASYDFNETIPYRITNNRACCGDDGIEGGPYQPSEKNPVDRCGDGRDNDCDGNFDMADSDCNGNCIGNAENNYPNSFTPGDCNQCDFEGSQATMDGQDGQNWGPYPGMADKCDVSCGTVAATVALSDFQPGSETRCDGIDNDCDGNMDEGCDDDSDGYCDGGMTVGISRGATCPLTAVANGANGDDCNDAEAGAHPGADDVCDNKDNDCNGTVDRSPVGAVLTRSCYSASSATNGVGTCHGGTQACDAGSWGGACSGEVVPGAEVCDGADNDCDNQIDESLGQTTCGLGMCANTVNNCVAGAPQACNPYLGAAANENCSTVGDDDCDGTTNGADSDCALQNYYCDNDNDNHWTATPVTCTGNGCEPPSCNAYRIAPGDDCNDSNSPDVYYRPQSELVMGGPYCSDSIDNNCHDGVNDGCPVPEICNDGEDNDLDGQIDGLDTADCVACYALDNDNDGYYQNVVSTYVRTADNCPTGSKVPNGTFDCGDSSGAINPGRPELCDGLDNDCNAATADGSGAVPPNNANQQGVCAGSKQKCMGGAWQNYYLSVQDYQVAETMCGDGKDNNCAGDGDCVCDNDGIPEVALGENCLNCSNDVTVCGATAGNCGVYFSGNDVAANEGGLYHSQPFGGSFSIFLGPGKYLKNDLSSWWWLGAKRFEGFMVDNDTTIKFWSNNDYTGGSKIFSDISIVNSCTLYTGAELNYGCNGNYGAWNCFGYGPVGTANILGNSIAACQSDSDITNYQSFEITCP